MEVTTATSFFTHPLSSQTSVTFSLTFEGNLPHDLHDSEVPFELTVHLLPEFASLCPVIQTIDHCPGAVRPRSEEVQPNTTQTHVVPISFLPLAPAFDKSSTVAWVTLASRVQSWLTFYIQDQDLLHWKWGAEVFWIAFIAAFPSFPLGEWPLWDRQVVPNDFEETVQRSSERTSEEDLSKRREELWRDFCKVVKVMYPFPIHDDEVGGQNV
ncbi:hypothetical protein EDB83DRAFT_2478248 [Lactarius deliciosus]|nr:hypothetical protein EDB83DRAFT_2478248 [Lactarius deliciosus]